jgi:predicted DNA-binding ribbon-helix-helix protein
MHTHLIRKQLITLRNGKLTTIGLEPEFFRALRLIAYSRSLTAADLIRNVEAQPRPWKQTLTSTLRCFVVREMMAAYEAQFGHWR